MVDYYSILQVMPSASDEVIKSAYKALGKKYHPDNQKFSPDVCEKMMAEINKAYEVLSDPVKRKEYDTQYHMYSSKEHSSQFSKEDDSYEKHETQEPVRSSEPEQEDESSVFQSLFRGIERMAQKNRQVIDNAYYEGTGMDDYELVRTFMKNYGFKRQGYAMVMEERELLRRDSEGKLVPTDKFRLYWR